MHQVLDEMGRTLWELLHVFDKKIQPEQERVGRDLPAMRDYNRIASPIELAARRGELLIVLDAENTQQNQMFLGRDCRKHLAKLMTLR